MKLFLLILSYLLSWSFCGKDKAEENFTHGSTLVQTSSQDEVPDFCRRGSLCLTSARTVNFTGESGGYAPSVRTLNSGRRVHSPARMSAHIVKSGKSIGRQTFQVFLHSLSLYPSGSFCPLRYIYSIHHLLI